MGFPCSDCNDKEYTCTAWDGKGQATRNLVETCPNHISECAYRKKKIKSTIKL